jgi:hypothetical protein
MAALKRNRGALSSRPPLDGSPDLNVLINHRHSGATRITIPPASPFTMDARLF